jgi:hypothetical protein
MNRFVVKYDIKHLSQKTLLHGVLTPETCKFVTLQDAIKFVRIMRGRRTSKYEVVGMPIIERI